MSGTSYPNTIAQTSNCLTQMQDITGTATIVHDAAGNITTDGTNTYRGCLLCLAIAGFADH